MYLTKSQNSSFCLDITVDKVPVTDSATFGQQILQ